MRICLVPPADLRIDSGSTLYARKLANVLVREGCDVSVVCSSKHPDLAATTIIAPIPLPHPFDDHKGTPNHVFVEAIRVTSDAILSHWSPRPGDVIHAIYPAYTGIAAGLVGSLTGATAIVTELGRIVNVAARERRYCRMAAIAFSSAHCVIAATEEIARKIGKEYAVEPKRIVMLGVPANLEEFALPLKRTDVSAELEVETDIVTICSCLTAEKGVTDLLAAFAAVQGDLPSRMRLVVVGPDPVDRTPTKHAIEDLAKQYGLQDRIVLTGYIPHSQIPSILSTAIVYVDARRVDNFSSVISEAMALRRPIIASGVGNNLASLNDSVDALLFPPGDIEALGNALRQICLDSGLRARLGARAGQWLERHEFQHSAIAHARSLLLAYQTTIAEVAR